jgi:hypothetical protein
MTELSVQWIDPEQAGVSFARVVRPWCHEQWKAGKKIAVHFCDAEEARSIQRNKEYWGYVLRPISEQAQIEGIGAQAEGWHDYYRKMFLGYEFTKVKEPGRKRPSIKRSLRSTTKLSERAMRDYCEQVRAHAATTFGVTFPALEDRP